MDSHENKYTDTRYTLSRYWRGIFELCYSSGQLPFGYAYLHYRLVKNQTEQGVIRLMDQARAEGLSLQQIAGQLNQRLVPLQAKTVRLILARA